MDFLENEETEIISGEQLLEERGIGYDEDEIEVETPGRDEQPAPPEKQPEPQKPIKNPEARARVLQREKRELQLAQQEMLQRMERLEQAILANKQPQQIEDEDLPDEHDPIEVLKYEQKQTRKILEEQKQQTEQQRIYNEQLKNLENALVHANNEIDYFASEVEDYNQAVDFLGSKLYEFIQDENPDLTKSQIQQQIQKHVAETKLWALQNNRNPGEVFYKSALRYGYSKSEPEEKEEKVDAREKIQKEKKIESRTRTLSNVPGSAPKSKIKVSQLPSDKFNSYLNDKIKAGELKVGSGKNRSPSAAELLSHKIYDDGRDR